MKYIVEKYRWNGAFNQLVGKNRFDDKQSAENYKNYHEEYFGMRCYIEEEQDA